MSRQPRLFTSLAVAACLLVSAQSAIAANSFSDDFNTASSGDYTEGGFVGGNNGWTAPTTGTPFFTTDVAGTGLVEIVPATDNFIDMGRSVGSLAVGETVTISSLFNIGSTGSAFNNALAWNIGIGDTAGAVDLGLGVGGDSTDWYIRGYRGAIGNTDLTGDDAGPLMGLGRDLDPHTISVDITKSATPDQFDLSWSFDATSLGMETITDSTLYNAPSLFLVGTAGGGGVNAVGGVDVDNFSITSDAPPGPETLVEYDSFFNGDFDADAGNGGANAGWNASTSITGLTSGRLRPGAFVEYGTLPQPGGGGGPNPAVDGYDDGNIRTRVSGGDPTLWLGPDHFDKLGNESSLMDGWGDDPDIESEQHPGAMITDRRNPSDAAFASGAGYQGAAGTTSPSVGGPGLGTEAVYNGSGNQVESPYYFEFSVEPDAGKALDLDKLIFDYQFRAVDGVDTFALYMDAEGDGFATGTTDKVAQLTDIGGSAGLKELDLSGLADITSEAVFRLYTWRSVAHSSNYVDITDGAGALDAIQLFGLVVDAPGVPGDFDGDGFVGLSDLNILGANFGTMGGATVMTGDANGDGDVDLADLNILGANWNPPPAVSVPEPTTLALAAFAAAGFLARRRS